MIKLKNRYFNLVIEYKNIKNLYLKIKDLNTLYITCSKRITHDEIIRFIYLKEDLILKKVEQMENNLRTSYLTIDHQISYLGQSYQLEIKTGVPNVQINDDNILIYTKHGTIEEGLKVFYKDRAKVLDELIQQMEPKYLNVLKDYGYRLQPQYFYKELKGRWGYCEVKNNKVVMNTHLIHFPKECLEAVLWHELLHFIIPNHSKRFHDILKMYMPKYQEIIKIMH